MNVKSAVKTAKAYLSDLLAEEGLTNLGLEEIEFDDRTGNWLVTLGFSRPWNSSRSAVTAITGEEAVKRAYRTLTIRDVDAAVLSVKRKDFVS